MKVAGIVLAAGSSRRLGEPKQLVFLGGETLLERAVRVAREAGLQPVISFLVSRFRVDMTWILGWESWTVALL